MASTPSVIFTMSRVPLVITNSLLRGIPLWYQAMVGEGSPEALQLRVSEALFPAASSSKTTVSWGSWVNMGGVPGTAQGEE